MKKLRAYIFTNVFHIINSILMSIAFVFLIFPTLINLEFIKFLLNEPDKNPFIGITALVLLFSINSWARIQNLWQRYKNTYKLEKPPFIYLDYVALLIIFSCILIPLFRSKFKFIFLAWKYRYLLTF